MSKRERIEQARIHWMNRKQNRPKQIWLDFFGRICNLKNQLSLKPVKV